MDFSAVQCSAVQCSAVEWGARLFPPSLCPYLPFFPSPLVDVDSIVYSLCFALHLSNVLLFPYYFLHHLLYLPFYSLVFDTLIVILILFDYNHYKTNVRIERFSNALDSFTVFLFNVLITMFLFLSWILCCYWYSISSFLLLNSFPFFCFLSFPLLSHSFLSFHSCLIFLLSFLNSMSFCFIPIYVMSSCHVMSFNLVPSFPYFYLSNSLVHFLLCSHHRLIRCGTVWRFQRKCSSMGSL